MLFCLKLLTSAILLQTVWATAADPTAGSSTTAVFSTSTLNGDTVSVDIIIVSNLYSPPHVFFDHTLYYFPLTLSFSVTLISICFLFTLILYFFLGNVLFFLFYFFSLIHSSFFILNLTLSFSPLSYCFCLNFSFLFTLFLLPVSLPPSLTLWLFFSFTLTHLLSQYLFPSLSYSLLFILLIAVGNKTIWKILHWLETKHSLELISDN